MEASVSDLLTRAIDRLADGRDLSETDAAEALAEEIEAQVKTAGLK